MSDIKDTGLAPAYSHRAVFAADPARSRGRAIAEAASASRTPFQRDRDRIIHSSAFRRLALKTQVFLPEEGDHYRTRLTHTIEVAQIARTLARALGLDEDLTETLALAHDLGHPPFGHTGEEALNEVLAPFGGFDHNAQTLRTVIFLERRYVAFRGLNLTWETVEGLVKRGGRRRDHADAWQFGDLSCLSQSTEWAKALEGQAQPSAEAQAAAIADDIAYNAHDLEDGLQARFFNLDDLDTVPPLASVKAGLLAENGGIGDDLLIRGMARQLVGLFVDDVIAESRRRLAQRGPASADDLRSYSEQMVSLSSPKREASQAIKTFLFARMYRHPQLLQMRSRSKQIVRDLTDALLREPELLPREWRHDEGSDRHPRRVADYVAGMTDRFAVAEHRRLFDGPPELR